MRETRAEENSTVWKGIWHRLAVIDWLKTFQTGRKLLVGFNKCGQDFV